MELEDILKRVKRYESFSSQPIPEESLRRVLRLSRKAPAPGGNLPIRVVIVRDEEKKKNIAEACGKRTFLAKAPLLLIVVGMPDEAEPFMGGYTNSFPLDSSVAMTLISLTAVEEGLGTNWILQFNDEKIKSILEIPVENHVVGVSPLGVPEDDGERYSISPQNMIYYECWED